MLGKRTNPLPTPVDTNLSLSSQEKGPLSLSQSSTYDVSSHPHPSGPQSLLPTKGLLPLPKNKADVELFMQMQDPQLQRSWLSHIRQK